MTDLACCVCGQMTNRFAGNPGVWPVPFGHIGGNGQTFIHCGDCCATMHQKAGNYDRMMYALNSSSTPEPHCDGGK